MSKIKIVHVISGLDVGGAELALYRLLVSNLQGAAEHQVINLGPEGPVGEKIRQVGVTVQNLEINPTFPSPLKVFHLWKSIKAENPDIVHTWMYHANLIGGIAAKLAGNNRVIWSIRQDIRETSWMKTRTKWVVKIGARLAGVVAYKIISVSQRAVSSHVNIGYPEKKFTVIPNGFDTDVYIPNPSAGNSVRDELGLENSAKLLGLFARHHPMKNHGAFLGAAQIAHKKMPELHFILCGSGVDTRNIELVDDIEEAGLADFVHLLGLRDDTARLYAALDLYTISSLSEGFPSSVGEAMASGVPCVVTDVGDSKLLVGDTGITVAVNDPKELAEGWRQMFTLQKKRKYEISKAARKRIVENYSIQKTIDEYYRIYAGMAD